MRKLSSVPAGEIMRYTMEAFDARKNGVRRGTPAVSFATQTLNHDRTLVGPL